AVDGAVGDHVHVAATGLVEVVPACRGGVDDRGGHRHADTQHPVGRGDSWGVTVAYQHTGRSGPHQVHRRAVVADTTGDDRDVQVGDEVLEVQRLVVLAADVLRRDDGALHDQDLHACGQQVRRQLGGVLRADPRGHRDV